MGKSQSSYHINANRLLKTIGVRVLNELDVMLRTSQPYMNYLDYYNNRFDLRNRNTGNISSYFFREDNQITFFGKLFGANVQEAIAMIIALRTLENDVKTVCYPVFDTKQKVCLLPMLIC